MLLVHRIDGEGKSDFAPTYEKHFYFIMSDSKQGFGIPITAERHERE